MVSIHRDYFKKLADKALTKKDGIYTLGGYTYAVKDNRMIFLVSYEGDVAEICFGSIFPIGQFKYLSNYKQQLKELIKKRKGVN